MRPADSLLRHCYGGTMTERLRLAERLYAGHSETLLAKPILLAELTLLRQAAANLSTHMAAIGLNSRCAACAATNPGGCCSAAIGDDCDVALLLINLLLGITIICQDDDPTSCRFLGPSGCIFTAKPIFCLNYNCDKILRYARKEDMAVLYHLVGETLGQQSHVEALLLDFLQKCVDDGVEGKCEVFSPEIPTQNIS